MKNLFPILRQVARFGHCQNTDYQTNHICFRAAFVDFRALDLLEWRNICCQAEVISALQDVERHDWHVHPVFLVDSCKCWSKVDFHISPAVSWGPRCLLVINYYSIGESVLHEWKYCDRKWVCFSFQENESLKSSSKHFWFPLYQRTCWPVFITK